MEKRTESLTPPYGRYLSRLTKPFPDFDFSFIKPVRRTAVELLKLKPGDRVLDVGCGPGGSFPFLVHAVGPTGQVVGVELSPVHSELARRRIASNQWKNVEVVQAAAQEVSLTGTFAGLLMFAAPDVYASKEALENIRPHLRDNARVAAFGAKLSHEARRGGVQRIRRSQANGPRQHLNESALHSQFASWRRRAVMLKNSARHSNTAPTRSSVVRAL